LCDSSPCGIDGWPHGVCFLPMLHLGGMAMLDIKLVRSNPEIVREGLRKRGHSEEALDQLLELDVARRKLIAEVEELKRRRNAATAEIAKFKKAGADASALIAETRQEGDRIAELDRQQADMDERQRMLLLNIPNIPNKDLPVGKSDKDNVEVRRWGTPTAFAFEPKAHWDLGTSLDILDFERAGKITGARFAIYKGLGARLERALISYMLELHIDKHGYLEVFPPFIVNRDSMIGTGQLPKFAEDMFKLEGLDYYLVPTAEVPVTNMYRGEILDCSKLPISHCAYTACFRAEAGASGRDTRGLIRQHEFDKVELVKFTKPEESYAELEKLTSDAEDVLKGLGLPYRVITLCTGDIGFSSAKTYDIEVWMPSYGRYVEISSCSNFESYQARRMDIKYRTESGKTEHVHTLNGSGTAVGRCFAAILENFQAEDGSVTIPEALRKYMGGAEKIS